MLHVFFNHNQEFEGRRRCAEPNSWFETTYKDAWMNDPFVKKIVKEIDNVEVVDSRHLYDESGVCISPVGLSASCKMLIMMYTIDEIKTFKGTIKMLFDGDAVDDKCYNDLIFQIAEKKDVYIMLTRVPRLPEEFYIYVDSCNVHVHTAEVLGKL